MQSKYLKSVAEIAAEFGVHPNTIRNWVGRGCPTHPNGIRTYRLDPVEVRLWLREQQQPIEAVRVTTTPAAAERDVAAGATDGNVASNPFAGL